AGIEAGLSIDELALGLHATDYFLYQRLYAMHRLGAVVVRAGRSSVSLGADDVSIDALLTSARTFLASQNFRDAYAVIRAAQALGSSSDGAELLKQLEAMWVPELRVEYLDSERVPEVLTRTGRVHDAGLSAPERYLLSRVDGARTINAIVRVAPLREFEALAAFDRFVTMGLVGFKP
ncbi:MAG: hypothetical protein JNG84_11640, partial [Archangium sp.]|nr:hypothetical protein [Archangium sp.]